MLNTWTARSFGAAARARAGRGDDAGDDALVELRVESGATGILASEMAQHYDHEPVPGEVIERSDRVAAVSTRRMTAVGAGWFVGYEAVFTDSAGRRVGRQSARVLYYRPAAGTPRKRSARTVGPRDQAVARLVVPVDRSLVVNSALATRDFNPVHHDPDFAPERGVDDVFFNIYSHLAFCERLVGERTGTAGRLRLAEVRLLQPALPGDELVYDAHPHAADGTRIAIVASSAQGTHVRGEVEVVR